MRETDVKAGPWEVRTKAGNSIVGFVVANTEHVLALSPDKTRPGNETFVSTDYIKSAYPLVRGALI